MFLFPLIFVLSFLASLRELLKKNIGGILLFFTCGLPIYITSLSIVNMYGLPQLVPVLQSFKEILVLIALFTVLYNYREKIQLHLVDKLMLFFFIYTFLYVLIPLGQYGFFQRLIAFKSSSFFVLVYFTGRFCNPVSVSISKYFRVICAVLIVATTVLLYELITYQHLQTLTGYAGYNYRFFQQDPSGSYDLSWTFEVNEIGRASAKRFASFFANPLEFAASVVLATSILIALYTDKRNRVKPDSFGIVALVCSGISIFFALSRASMISYLFIMYVYAFLTGKRKIIRFIHIFFILVALYVIYMVNKDIRGFIINTLSFNNLSSLGHLVEWMDGIRSMIASPLGIGLGESGRIAGTTGENVGGESQLIILGVQAGVIAMGVYIAVYVISIRLAFQQFRTTQGPERKLSLALLLARIGLIIPMATTNFESYIYISYTLWFFSGVFIAAVMRKSDTALRQIPGIRKGYVPEPE
jgi:hypothetical protein